jgi:H+/gluconate symporter-like permease
MQQIVLILLFVLLFGFLAYRKWSPILLGPTVSLILCLVAGLPVLSTMLGPYLNSATNFIKNNFFVFFLGAIFGAIMERTGGARSIAVWMSKATNKRYTLPLIMTIAGLLCYGGVIGFVVYFAIYPIALHLCKEANISRALIPGTIGAGCWTWANALPGSPSVPNVTASKYLSTPPTADLLAGIIWGGVVLFVLNFIYLEWQARRYTASGRGFIVDDVVSSEMESAQSDAALPHPLIALAPMVLILVLFNIVKLAIEWSLLAGVISAIILMYKYGGPPNEWLKTCNKGASNTAGVILNVSLVVGFAGVMQQTAMFKALVDAIGTVTLPPAKPGACFCEPLKAV